MKNYKTYHNYDLKPCSEIYGFDNEAFAGNDEIICEIKSKIQNRNSEKTIISFDLYPNVSKNAILQIAKELNPDVIIDVEEAKKSEIQLLNEFDEYITNDRVFGIICHKKADSFYDEQKKTNLINKIKNANGVVILVGFATELFAKSDIHILCDISRWEIQLRFRKGAENFICENSNAPILTKFKIGYFIEWRIADRYKKEYFDSIDYLLDANDDCNLTMVTGNAFRAGINQLVSKPFRMEPYFDSGVWGGKWMQNTLDVQKDAENLAWCFDGVPEENAVNLKFGETIIQIPTMDVTLYKPRELLGERVHARFGAEYPIRFDFLDTIDGQNLSLQVHPLTEYIQNEFGMHYTQDESYYILDADEEEDTYVYLGVKNGVDKNSFEDDLRKAEKGEIVFPADNYVNKIPVKKHDHVLIPAGTIHCSGKGCMVLEISATPYIFTFKLWDWERLGLDGLPRPIHINHGMKNIMWNRDTDFVYEELVKQEKILENTDEYMIERTGLHAREPLDVFRYTITKGNSVLVKCNDSVVQGNLVEGKEFVIESNNGEFKPFLVHYSETFIVPANVKEFKLTANCEDIKVILTSVK